MRRSRLALLLVLVLVLLGLAAAQLQPSGARLPLATTGTVLRWAPHVDEMTFELPEASWVRLSVYSPSIDLDEVGDERYDQRPLEAEFRLRSAATGEDWLAQRSFAFAPSAWTVLYDGLAQAGRYSIESELVGHGKNVYLLRLETEHEGVALRAEQVTVNVSSRDWHDALSFEIDSFARCELGMYDGDGAKELEARLLLPSGARVQMQVSEDLEWSTQALPRLQGVYVVETRVPASAYQATNAVRFELRCGGTPVAIPLTEPLTLTDLFKQPVPLPEAWAELRPAVPVPLPDPLAIVTMPTVEAPEGADATPPEGTPEGVDASSPGEEEDEPGALPPSDAPPTASELPGPPAAALNLLREIDTATLAVCELTDARLVVRNVGATASTYSLVETAAPGLTLIAAAAELGADGSLLWSGDLAPGAVAVHHYRVLMGPGGAESLALEAVLAWDGDGLRDWAELRRAPLGLSLSRLPADGALYADSSFEVVALLSNPLDRDIVVWLEPVVSSRVTLLSGPEAITVPALGQATASYALQGVESGAAAFRLTMSACAPAEGSAFPGVSDNLLLTLSDPPEPPVVTMSTTVTVELGVERLPTLEGLAVVSRLPTGAHYESGSSRLDGEPIDDPRQLDGALVHELPGRDAALLSFGLLHDDVIDLRDEDHALIALTPRPEVLVGEPAALEVYRREAAPIQEPVVRERVGALILDPAPGTVVRGGSSVAVTVDAELGHQLRLYVNDEPVPESRIGETVRDSGLGRQTLRYIGVPLRPGPNVLRLEAEDADGAIHSDELVVSLAGLPATITLTPLSPLVTDTVESLLIAVDVADAWGVAPLDSFVTVDVAGAVVAGRDDNRQQAGHQVAFENGRGVLELAPFAAPGSFTVLAAVGTAVTEASFTVEAATRPWIVAGIASAGASYGQDLRFGVSASVFARGTVLEDALLTVAARYPFGPLGVYGDPYERFPVMGSDGALSAAGQSRHGVYFRLERQQSFLQYGDFVTSFAGGLQPERAYTGLSGRWVGAGGFGLQAYGAYVPVRDAITGLEIRSDGTSAYRLPHAPLLTGSLRLAVVKRHVLDGYIVDDGDPLTRTLLEPADYVVDEVIGLIMLARPLPLADGDGNTYHLQASYRLLSLEAAPARAQFGVELSYDLGGLILHANLSQESGGEDDFERVATAGASLSQGPLAADVEVGFGQDESSGGFAVTARASYDLGSVRTEAGYRYFSVGYRSSDHPDDRRAGHTGTLGVSFALTPELSLAADGRVRVSAGSEDVEVDARLLASYQSAGAVFLGDRMFAARLNLRAGVQLESGGVGAIGSVALRDPLGLSGTDLSVSHVQGLSAGVASTTDFSIGYRLSDALQLRLTERVVWGEGHLLLLGLQSSFENAELLRRACLRGGCEPGWPVSLGRSTVIAQYEMPGGLGAEAGRWRLGLDTRYPLSDELSVEGSIARLVDNSDPNQSATVLTAGLAYDSEDLDAELRYEVRFSPLGTKQVAAAGLTAALDQRTFGSVTLRWISDPSSAPVQGLGFSVAAAFRGDRASLLTHHRGRFGSVQLQGGSEIEGDTRFSVNLSRVLELRAGHAYQLLPGSAFVDMLSLGTTAHLWQGGSATVYGRMLHDWTLGTWVPGASVELSQGFGCGLYGVAGYNAWDGIGADHGAVFGRPGVFLRVDAVFDENWRCRSGGARGVDLDD